jgi:predicted TIM-barrel fold metal-dependent hydrolase
MPPEFFEGWSRTVKSNLPFHLDSAQESRFDDFLHQLVDDPNCDKLQKEMDSAGIDQAVLLVIDFGIAYKRIPLTIEEIHLEHRKIMERSDRFVAFSNVDPRRGKEGLDLFEKAVREWGFRGMKLYAPCGYSPDDKMLFPYYEICRELHLPVLTHVGPTTATLSFKNTRPECVDDAAFNFSDVNFILGHAAVRHYQDAALLAQYRPNVYLDLSGFQTCVNRNELRAILGWHIERGLAKKLLFGTDWPIYRFWGSQQYWIKEFRSFQQEGWLSEEDLQSIFGRNLAAILPLTGVAHAANAI